MKRIIIAFSIVASCFCARASFTKAEVDEQVGGVYGELYAHEGVATQSITNGAGYTKCTGFLSNGQSSGTTPDHTTDVITITKAGIYKVECSLSFTGSGVNINWFGAVFLDDVEQDQIHFERKINTGGDYGSTQFGGYIVVSSVPVDVDIRFRHDDVSDRDITVRYANFNITRIGI
jgi:hypothetical protein